MAYKRLGDLLVSASAITEWQLQQALEIQKETKKRLGETLIENKFITEEQLVDVLRIQLGVDFIDLTKTDIPVELAKFIPKNIAKRYNVIPVKFTNGILYVAMSDPLDFVAQEEVKSSSHKEIIPMIATRKATENAIAALYGNEGTARAIEEMKKLKDSTPDSTPKPIYNQSASDEDDVTSAPTIRFVNSIIQRAFSERASDVHLEPQEGVMVVRMRIDGSMRKLFTVPAELQNTVISRLKIMGNMNISEHMIPQDGHSSIEIDGHVLDVRISSIPTIYGEKIVLRLLDKSASLLTKEAIGLTGSNLAKYEKLIRNSSGVILLVGPTGSGKSTTLTTMLRELSTEEVNIVTLEDPVEYNIPGCNQCQINEKTGMTFAAGLRSILRQDPDIISVGEIRDGETASIAIRAAITGHLVLSTLHTNTAATALTRLEDIGIEKFFISSALRGVISQRLVKRICPNCRVPYKPTAEELAVVGLPADSDAVFYKGTGCPECNHRGYKGRHGAFEILIIDADVRQAINENKTVDEIEKIAAKNGFMFMKDSCRELVLNGITTVDEAFKAINSASD